MSIFCCNTKQALAIIPGLLDAARKPHLVAIAGGSCSGKSYFATGLDQLLQSSSLICQDWYFKDLDDPALPRLANGLPALDLPASFHNDELTDHLGAVLSGEAVYAPVYEVEENTRVQGRSQMVPAKQIIILEGLYAIDAAEGLDHAAIFIEADYRLRESRRVQRDVALCGFEESDVRAYFRSVVEDCYAQQILPQRDKAYMVIRNNFEFEEDEEC